MRLPFDPWITRREQGFLLFLLALLLLGGIVHAVRGHGKTAPPEPNTNGINVNESEAPK